MKFFDGLAVPGDFDRRYGPPPRVRRPKPSEAFRVHPKWQSPEVAVVERGTGGDYYLVGPKAFKKLAGQMVRAILQVAVTADGDVLCWGTPVSQRSTMEAAEKATSEWLNINWSQTEKGFVASPVKESLHEPDFMYDSAEELFERALHGRIISDPNDEIVASILGEEEGEEVSEKVDDEEVDEADE